MTLDPRRSLAAGLTWLVIALAATFAGAASLWAGRVAREIVVQQHVRRLVLETDQLGSDLGQALSARLAAIRSVGDTPLPRLFETLMRAYPALGWVALADAHGTVLAGDGHLGPGTSVAAAPWFARGFAGPWIGTLGGAADTEAHSFADLSIPMHDSAGRTVAVVAAHLTSPWAAHDLRRLSASLDPAGSAETLVIDAEDRVLVGPAALLDRRWSGTRIEDAPFVTGTAPADPASVPRFERLGDGRIVLVARAPLVADAGEVMPDWRVQLGESKERVYQRADALAVRIVWISVCLGAVTAALGALGARHLTDRLRRLTRSAAAVGRNESERIDVPGGHDEVAQLAAVLAKVLGDLRQERSELLALSGELERRVALRTREVQRLAEESRYAAIVRERLKIARDLHDTLAHSMMAMLSEVRLLRKLHAHDPTSLPDELARAEEVAHDGLNEARTAITQMRLNAVRDTGMGPALAKAFDRFIDRTGVSGTFTADSEAASFGDERAETLFQMAEEALRNIERHAMASRVVVTLTMVHHSHLELRIEDDGVGFDTAAAHPGHFGLVGLREQAQLLDADLQILSVPNAGTTLIVSLRIAPETLGPLAAAHAV